MEKEQLRSLLHLLNQRDPSFWDQLRKLSEQAFSAEDLLQLNNLHRKARSFENSSSGKKIKLAVIGGFTFHPLDQLLLQKLLGYGFEVELFLGEYDNYPSEILSESSELYEFGPDLTILIPSERRCKYLGHICDAADTQKHAAEDYADEILQLCETLRERAGCEIVLGNHRPLGEHDLGHYRSRSLGSDWNFKKLVNFNLALKAAPWLHILDLEFLANRRGYLNSIDARRWYESKQIGSIDYLADIANEAAHIVAQLKRAPKKVVVLDLDNTLWGGVIGDDDVSGIELGDTSPRGEAFKDFQKYIRSVKDLGLILAVASKNNEDVARRPFVEHPDMVIKADDIVSFKANWGSKADSISEMAQELNLGLDSFVFIDDNPAEIQIVNQFLPQVSTILLPPDPADFVAHVRATRLLEVKAITAEDREKTEQYQTESRRVSLKKSVTDMGAYLTALEMVGTISPFTENDVPRISQLINKSNQFNLTTRRKTESDVRELMNDPNGKGFTVRLRDKYGDYGLISVVIPMLEANGVLEVESFVMSCRVLERGVETEICNKLKRIARANNCRKIRGVYLPTAKNAMVKELYSRLGFKQISSDNGQGVFELESVDFETKSTKIRVQEGNV